MGAGGSLPVAVALPVLLGIAVRRTAAPEQDQEQDQEQNREQDREQNRGQEGRRRGPRGPYPRTGPMPGVLTGNVYVMQCPFAGMPRPHGPCCCHYRHSSPTSQSRSPPWQRLKPATSLPAGDGPEPV